MPFKLILRRCEVVFWCLEWECCTFLKDWWKFIQIYQYYTMALKNCMQIMEEVHSTFFWRKCGNHGNTLSDKHEKICLADLNLCIIMSSSLIWIVWNLKEEVLSTKILPWKRLVQQTQEVHFTHLHLKSLYVNQLSFESNENCESSTPNVWAKLWLAVTMARPCPTNKKENIMSCMPSPHGYHNYQLSFEFHEKCSSSTHKVLQQTDQLTDHTLTPTHSTSFGGGITINFTRDSHEIG